MDAAGSSAHSLSVETPDPDPKVLRQRAASNLLRAADDGTEGGRNP